MKKILWLRLEVDLEQWRAADVNVWPHLYTLDICHSAQHLAGHHISCRRGAGAGHGEMQTEFILMTVVIVEEGRDEREGRYRREGRRCGPAGAGGLRSQRSPRIDRG